MIKKILNKAKKFKSSIKVDYLNFLDLPIDDKLVLLEGGQGSNINGNMFSMLRELETNSRWSDYKCAFVVTDNTIEKAQSRMDFYGFKDVKLVVRNSNQYCKYLATAKYIMTDNSFPPYFQKREEQVFLNTWHGTPLKTLGKSDKSNLASLANIQKNYFMSDYALFPNEFTRDVFMDDYDLRNIFAGNSLIANYPRNYVFYDKQQGIDMKKTLGYEGKTVFAYMPTWRGTGRTASIAKQTKMTIDILTDLDEKLDDDVVVLVNLHFLLAGEIDCVNFKHIKYFPTQYDTYEVLNGCDGLITDYSSVFFDFAITKKKIILYAYDKKEYLGSRGIYMPFESLPFPIVETIDDVIKEIKSPANYDQEFLDKYCTNGCAESCEKLFELMVTGKSDYYKLEKNEDAGKNICLIYAGALPAVHFDNIKNYIAENPGYKYVIAYRKNFKKASKEFVLSLDKDITTLGTVSAFQMYPKEVIKFIFKDFNNETMDEFFKREANRIFYSLKPEKVVDFSLGNILIAGMLSKLSDKKYYVKHGDYFCLKKRIVSKVNKVTEFEKNNGFEEIDLFEKENQFYLDNNEDGIAHGSFRANTTMNNILPLYFSTKKNMHCVSLFNLKTPCEIALKDTTMFVGKNEYTPKYIANKSIKSKRHFGIYSLTIPISDVIEMPANNPVCISYNNKYNHQVKKQLSYFALLRNYFFGLRSPMAQDKESATVAIFRQMRKNKLSVYVRSFNYSDKIVEQIKQILAFIVAPFWQTKKAKKLVLLYEKNSSKYEESASVLYENLIDDGYDNVYFILDRNYEYINKIPEKYKSHIIYKYTFKHYLYFFKSKTFIGTEALVHSIDLKTFNVLPLKKISSKNLNYVFLQHGVMYMVSLDSESRKMFKRKRLNGCYRVVVSSQAESDHFTQLGRHYEDDIYITGLPKYDRNVMNDDADKIVIMPTWRPWEINTIRDDFTETGYFKMIMNIYNSVPDDLKEKVIILPHPLVLNELKHIEESVAKKMLVNARYDDILKETRLLITDYSSIAYDAFYRGARVIFYWEEKDECMANYGPTTKLMLNENNVYGDYFYNTDGLSEAIRFNYDNPQQQTYIDRYSEIVEFRDGKNTERLIQFLKEDNII